MIIYPHCIRLRGPWECESATEQPIRVRFPCDTALPKGPKQFRRRFGYPGQIDAEERIWLTFDAITGQARLSLNGNPITVEQADVGYETNVTELLQTRNELLLEMDQTPANETFGEIALEIRRTAYLRGLRAELEDGRIVASGVVIGEAERPLDLYLIGERRVLAQSVVEASRDGTDFVLQSENQEDNAVAETVRIELVDASTVWYSSEMPLK